MNPDYINENRNKLMRWIIILAVAAIGVYAILWVAKQSSIEITLPAAGKGTASYELTSGSKESSGNFKDGSTKKKLAAPKGNYEVLVTQGEASYYALVKTSGFFKKTEIKAVLAGESTRTFVGDNPDSCLDYVSGLL